MIKIKITAHRIGYYLANPLNQKLKKVIIDHLASWDVESDGQAFFQNKEMLLQSIKLSKSEIRDLDKGYSIVKKIDVWEFLHFYGWDSHLIVENGKICF